MKPHSHPGRDKHAHSSPDDRDAAITILITMADTTWRIFTPVVFCTGLGIWADLSLGTKPWLTFLGVGIGFVIAGLLIRAQLKKVQE